MKINFTKRINNLGVVKVYKQFVVPKDDKIMYLRKCAKNYNLKNK